jgi:hypothetical protein
MVVVPLCFVALGLVVVVAGTTLATGGSLVFAFFLAVPAGIFAGLGIAYLTLVPHTVSWDDKRLVLMFALRRDRVTWTDIDWYKKFGVVWDVGEPRSAGVRVLTRYKSEKGVRRIALVGISGDRPEGEQGRSIAAGDYVTPFDRYVRPRNLSP